jgi:hypothetical protein
MNIFMNFRRCEMQINHTELLVCGYSRHYLFATYLFCIDQTQCWDKELPTNLTKKDIWNIRMHARSWHSSPSTANCKAYRRLPGSMDHQKHKLAWDPWNSKEPHFGSLVEPGNRESSFTHSDTYTLPKNYAHGILLDLNNGFLNF